MKTERELFEELPEIRDSISEHIVFIGNKYTTPNPDFYDLVNWLNGAWYAWQARVPEGYVVVPKEPTCEMIDAAIGNNGHIESIYRDMIEAVEK